MIPVILIIRDPDWANEIETYGVDARVIDIDLGQSFDGPKGFRAMDAADREEWLESTRLAFEGLPADHPARERFEELVAELEEQPE